MQPILVAELTKGKIMNMMEGMSIAAIGGLVSLTFSDLAVACGQALGDGHIASRHTRILSRAMMGLWLAAVVDGLHTLKGH